MADQDILDRLDAIETKIKEIIKRLDNLSTLVKSVRSQG